MKIIKRNGSEAVFDREKIEIAISKANAVVEADHRLSEDAIKEIAKWVEEYCEARKHAMSVEEIQDLVEKGLMATKRKDVAKAYVTYRYERDKIRNRNSALRKDVLKKIKALNVENQNANVDE